MVILVPRWFSGMTLLVLLQACGGDEGARASSPGGTPSDGGAADVEGDAGLDAGACRAVVPPGPSFGPSVALSDPAHAAFVPAIAARGDTVLVAWHEFVNGESRVSYTLIRDGCVGPAHQLEDSLGNQKRPSVASTLPGFVLAYEARENGTDVLRSVSLDANGDALGPPETLSPAGQFVAMPQVAASGDELAYAWTTGSEHWFLRRGALESLGPSRVGSVLADQTVLDVPRIALGADGTLFLVHRDGDGNQDWEVLLRVRPPHGGFAPAVNVSMSPGLLSDDVSLALADDGTLLVAWVDQDPVNVSSFEVEYALRSPAGSVSSPSRFATQSLWSWTPSIVASGAAAWRSGQGAFGDLWFATPSTEPERILGSEQGSATVLAASASGDLHLAYTDASATKQVRFAWRR